MEFKRILIIQSAFIGDVVLATSLIRKLKKYFPESSLDFLLRKGNENLLEHDKDLNKILIWDKQRGRIREMFRLLRDIRKEKYDLIVNVQRFASMGILTWLSGATVKVGFNKNPLSVFFHYRVDHDVRAFHEIERNQQLISEFTDNEPSKPSLHFSDQIEDSITQYKSDPYIIIAPTSIWFTKQFPLDKWIEFINQLKFKGTIFLIGSKNDFNSCEQIQQSCQTKTVYNLSGRLSLLQSACLMKYAKRNYVNDSAPLHFASAVNAPVTAVFCSTVPDFGFGPLSNDLEIVQVQNNLDCRPCGLHGYKHCPKGHFKCGKDINVESIRQP